MHRAHKTRLVVNNKQGSLLMQCCGASRFAYNTCLAKWNEDYSSEDQIKHNRFSIKKWFNGWKVENAPWTYSYSKWIYEAAIYDLAVGFDKFFKGQCRHPRFHKRGVRDSFRIDGSAVKVDGNLVRLPKGIVLKMAEPFRYESVCEKICSVTVSRSAGYWFVSISCEVADAGGESQTACVGIDMGLKSLATLSDGSVVENPRAARRRERRMKHLQRELSRKQKGSKNRQKAKLRLSRYQYRTACMRRDYIHKATTEIARRYGVVFLEDLNVIGMSKGRNLGRSMGDAAMSMFMSQLGYKAHVEKIDRWYPSSQTCSSCGHKQPMPLSVRTYECQECGMVMDRDLNAAINIMNLGAANYPEVMPVEGVEVKQFYRDWLAERSEKQESISKPT